MKTTIIDILNIIARGEQPPKKIIFRDVIYEYDEDDGDYRDTPDYDALFDYFEITDILNEEVQILETTITYKQDVQIKKLLILTFSDLIDMPKEELVDVIKEQRFKINEIIDKLNKEV